MRMYIVYLIYKAYAYVYVLYTYIILYFILVQNIFDCVIERNSCI